MAPHAFVELQNFVAASGFDQTSPLDQLTSMSTLAPRAYPHGFGHGLKRAWEQHLSTCSRRELRFKPEPFHGLPDVEQFQSMALDDLWDDAKLWEPLAYLFSSKKLRWGSVHCAMMLDQSTWFDHDDP